MLERDIEAIFKDIDCNGPKALVDVPSFIFHIAMDYADTPEFFKKRMVAHIDYLVKHPHSLLETTAANALRSALDETVFKDNYVDEKQHIAAIASDQNLAVIMQYICIVMDMYNTHPMIIVNLVTEIMETYVQRVRRKLEGATASGFVNYIQNKLHAAVTINVSYCLKPRLSLG